MGGAVSVLTSVAAKKIRALFGDGPSAAASASFVKYLGENMNKPILAKIEANNREYERSKAIISAEVRAFSLLLNSLERTLLNFKLNYPEAQIL